MARKKALWTQLPNANQQHMGFNPDKATTEHERLVILAAGWLERRCPLVVTEMTVGSGPEQPDVIGWKGTHSFLIECKASREDFRRDRDKVFRKLPDMGIGSYRYFMVPAGLIGNTSLPEGWGMLEVDGDRIRQTVNPVCFTERNMRHELGILLSTIRRIGQMTPEGIAVRCYYNQNKCRATMRLAQPKDSCATTTTSK